jgi:hypothetical protein
LIAKWIAKITMMKNSIAAIIKRYKSRDRTLRQTVFATLKPNIFLKQAVLATIATNGDNNNPIDVKVSGSNG